jgi:hypothetical protein
MENLIKAWKLTLGSTVVQYSTTTLAMEIIAYRDIEPGEEITLSCRITPHSAFRTQN